MLKSPILFRQSVTLLVGFATLFISSCEQTVAPKDVTTAEPAMVIPEGAMSVSGKPLAQLAMYDLPPVNVPASQLLATQRAMNPQYDASRRPSRLPQDFDKRLWDHRLPLFNAAQITEYSSDFGWRSLWGRRDFHGGVDLQAPKGTPIFAISDGQIDYLERAGKNGGVVMRGLAAQNGHHFTYWHMVPSPQLAEGMVITKGSMIGTMGNWGPNTHLHYAVHATGGQNYKDRKDTNALHPFLYHANPQQAVM